MSSDPVRIAHHIEQAINDALRLCESPIGIGDPEVWGIALRYAERINDEP